MLFALLAPANAQFWGDSWGRQQPQQRQQPYNPFGGFWDDRQQESPRYYPRQRERVKEPEREEPPDYSHAPAATPRKDATIKIVVMGEANADWPLPALARAKTYPRGFIVQLRVMFIG